MIGINNFTMPPNANDCKFFKRKEKKNRIFYCLITGKRQAIYKYENGKYIYKTRRCDNCPLTEIN